MGNRLVWKIWLCVVWLLFGMAAQRTSAEETVTVFAAASLTSALEEIAFLAQAHGVPVRFSFGGSSTLARQIEQGAPADLYFSASMKWMEYLEKQDLLVPGTRTGLLGNALVVIVPKGERFRVEARKGFDFSGAFAGRLALGDPSHVPAGIYATQALIWMGWWERVSGRLVPTSDVRAALVFVERGECAAGIVYSTDAAISTKVEVVAQFPQGSHDPIVYPIAVVKDRNRKAVEDALAFFRSPEALAVFRRYGFRVLEKDGTDAVER